MLNIIYIVLVVLNLISLIINAFRGGKYLADKQYGLANSCGISQILNAVIIFGLLILMKL